MTAEKLVHIEHLSKRYGQRAALSDVSLDLEGGRIVGLLGPNGSGKTTLIKILTGMLQEYTGTVSILGNVPGVESKKVISYLPDKAYFADWMRVRDALDVFCDFFADFDRVKAAELLNRLGLDPAMRVKSMSKGMVEKLSLTLTMARRAKLYVLDEPIGGVDPAARELILDTILNNYSEDGSILLSTHLIGDVERIFDTVVFLKEGQIALCDDVDAVREKNGMSIDQLFREVFKC